MITKQITVGDHQVQITADKIVRSDKSIVMKITATLGELTHTQNWTLPYDNHEYSQAQAQIDFDAHCQKVAKAMLGRFAADTATNHLK